MTPYYDEAGVTIYHARCEDILPSIEPATVGLLLTDPPYGMGLDTDYSRGGEHSWKGLVGRGHKWEPVEGDDQPFDPAHLLAYKRLVIFGGNHFASKLPDSGGWIVWNKRGDGQPSGFHFGDCELAWTNLSKSIRMYSFMWHGVARMNAEPPLHPTQKPVSLMRWIIDKWTAPGDLVLDPYMGSGSVLRAAKDCGRRAIGIECVEHYCEVAAKRLAQEVLMLDLPEKESGADEVALIIDRDVAS